MLCAIHFPNIPLPVPPPATSMFNSLKIPVLQYVYISGVCAYMYRYMYRCAFLPNSGAFFIGYIIMTALIGTSVKLLRVPELILYTFRRARAKTTLQREMALKKVGVVI